MRTSSLELVRLEALARGQGVRLIYSREVPRGGHCLLRGKPLVLIGSQLSAEEKAEVLRAYFSSLERNRS